MFFFKLQRHLLLITIFYHDHKTNSHTYMIAYLYFQAKTLKEKKNKRKTKQIIIKSDQFDNDSVAKTKEERIIF